MGHGGVTRIHFDLFTQGASVLFISMKMFVALETSVGIARTKRR